MYGFGLDVPTPAGIEEITPGAAYCGSLKGVQQMLADLGLYGGAIDGLWGPGTQKALTDVVMHHGIDMGSGLTKDSCQKLYDAWAASQGVDYPSVPGMTADPVTPGQKLWALPATEFDFAKARQAVSSHQQMLDPNGKTNGGSITGWWKRQSKTTQYAIMGGGALAIIGAVYYFAIR